MAVLHTLTLAVLALSAILVLVHAWRGPDVFERAISIESLAIIVVAGLLLTTPLGVDAALGLALFSFVGTAMLGYFLGRGEFPHE